MEERWKNFQINEQTSKEETFTALYSQNWLDLYKFAFYTLQNSQDAEDVVQDTIAIAFDKFDSLRDKNNFRFWIFKILSNCCKRKLRTIISNKKNAPIDSVLELKVLDNSEGVTKSIDLYNALNDLDKEESLIVNLSFWSGYKSHEISKILNIPAATIRSKLHRTLKKLKSKIEE